MNCKEFRTPEVNIRIGFKWDHGEQGPFYSVIGHYDTAFNSRARTTNKRLRYAACTAPPSYTPCSKYTLWPQTPIIRKDHLCGRFKLFDYTASGYFENVILLDSSPAIGLNIFIDDQGIAYYSDVYCYLNYAGSTANNLFFVNNLKPWDENDPFYARNLAKWNELTAIQKELYIDITGYYTPEPSEEIAFRATGTFAENSHGQTCEIDGRIFFGGTGTAGTGTASLNIDIH